MTETDTELATSESGMFNLVQTSLIKIEVLSLDHERILLTLYKTI